MVHLTLKAPITTAADYTHKYFFIVFSEKIRVDVSSESSARQRIHMKYQAVFSSKDKSKKLKSHLLQFLFGALRVKGTNVSVEDQACPHCEVYYVTRDVVILKQPHRLLYEKIISPQHKSR